MHIFGGTLAAGSLNALGARDVYLDGGTLETFNGPRAITIGRDYHQIDGTLRIQIGGLDSGSASDFLTVTRNAFLGGELFLQRINGFRPVPGDRIPILETLGAAGRIGTFDSMSNDFPGLIQPFLEYFSERVDVVFDLSNTFASQAVTPNQGATAANIDNAVGDPRADALIAFLGSEPVGNLPQDYDLIAPEEFASIYEIGFSQAVVQNSNLQHRMDDIRAGSTGFCSNNFVTTTSGKDDSGKNVASEGGKVVLTPDKEVVLLPPPENRWGVFATGSGDFVDVGNGDDNAHGYDITTGNVTVGVDYRVCDHFAIGIDGGYSGSTADLVDRGRVEVDGGKTGAYATVYGYKLFGSVLHVDGAVTGGWNSYDTHRTGLEDITVRGSTNGSEINALIAYGADWRFGCLDIGTWSTLQYTNVSIESFTEQGSLAPLHIEDQSEDSIRGTTGIRLAYDFKVGRAIVRPEVRAAWQHEYGDQAYPIDARLASGAGGVFTVHGPEIGRDSALVDAGLSILWNSRVSTYVYYDGVLGRSNYDNNAVSGGLGVSF